MIPVNKGAVSLVLEGSNVGRGNVWYVLHFSLVYVTADYIRKHCHQSLPVLTRPVNCHSIL